MSTAGESLSPQASQSGGPAISEFSALFRPSPFLDQFSQWISTLVGTDQLIMLVQYILDIVTHHMNHHTVPCIFYVLSRRNPFLQECLRKPSSEPSSLSTRLHKLSLKLADTRILLRLHGIIPTYRWFLATHASPPSDPTIAMVTKLQTYANMLYFPLENAAYLASHSILPMSKHTETQLWLWSCRFWAAYVALELFRLYRERQIHQKGKEKEKPEEENRWRSKWLAGLIMNLAYAPQTLHWSVDGGILSDVQVAYLGVVAAVTAIYIGWPSSS